MLQCLILSNIIIIISSYLDYEFFLAHSAAMMGHRSAIWGSHDGHIVGITMAAFGQEAVMFIFIIYVCFFNRLAVTQYPIQ